MSTLYAKLKPEDELRKLLRASIVDDILNVSKYATTDILSGHDRVIPLRVTSNQEVFVEVNTGWNIPESCIEYFIQPVCDTKDSIDKPLQKHSAVSLETAEGSFDAYPSLTIPEETKERIEALGDINDASGVSTEFPITDAISTPFVMTKSMLRKVSVQRHRTHYVKLVLKNEHLSFRFFYESEDNKHQEGNWCLKDHEKKAHINVDKEFVEKHFEDVVGAFEVIGRLLPKKGYMKIIKNLHNGEIEEVRE